MWRGYLETLHASYHSQPVIFTLKKIVNENIITHLQQSPKNDCIIRLERFFIVNVIWIIPE